MFFVLTPPVAFGASPLPEGAFDIAEKFPFKGETSRNVKTSLFEGGGAALAVTEGVYFSSFKNSGSSLSISASAFPRWLMASFSSGVSWA